MPFESDPTEAARRQLCAQINAKPSSRESLEVQYGQVWDTEQLKTEFIVQSFLAPFIFATRRSDNQDGTLLFQHAPRYYFGFDAVTTATTPENAE
jgi:hypothetical protein